MNSEVAWLTQQIELECQALKLALKGYGFIANYEAINHKYRSMGEYQDRLQSLVGEQEAMRVVYETYHKVVG
jgi:hypothetical protein